MHIPELTSEQKVEVNELWGQWEETVKVTAANAKNTWCSNVEFQDLIQEGFFCLLRGAGYTSTKGYDSSKVGAAAFKTYFVTLLSNHYRDLGSAHGRHISRISYVGELTEQLATSSEPIEFEETPLLAETLWKVVSPIARVILDVRWCSFPEKVPLIQISKLLNISYDKVLKANEEIRQAVGVLKSRPERVKMSHDCFGKCPDLEVAECSRCVDSDFCVKVFSGSKTSTNFIKGGLSMSEDLQVPPPPPMPEAPVTEAPVTEAPVTEAPAIEAPAVKSEISSTAKRTQTEVAFERLTQGPASRKELTEKVAAEFPNTKGARVGMLLADLRKKELLTEDVVEVEITDEEGVVKKKKVKKSSLVEDAVEKLIESGEVKVLNSDGGENRYIVKLRF